MTVSRCCCKWFQMCSSEPLVVESIHVVGGKGDILFQRCMCHHCLSLLDSCGGHGVRSVQKCTQRAKPCTCPSNNCVLSRALRCSLLCSWPGHKRLSLYVAFKTLFFLMHNYFQGPLCPTVKEGRWRHADPKGLCDTVCNGTGQGISLGYSHVWPDTSLCCSLPVWHSASSSPRLLLNVL